MNKKAAKRLRKIINPTDPISRRVYRRSKEQYKKVPQNLREDFLNNLERIIGGEIQKKSD